MTGLLRTRHPPSACEWHVAGSGRGRRPVRCVFFYLNFDVAPLSLRLAKTDSLVRQEWGVGGGHRHARRGRPSASRKGVPTSYFLLSRAAVA
jgi:hypothetical protein